MPRTHDPAGLHGFSASPPRLSDQLEARRGWHPPQSSRGMLLAAASLILVGVAGAGLLFFFGPEARTRPTARTAEPVSSAMVLTHGELPEPSPADTAGVRTITPADLPSASPAAVPVRTPIPPRAAAPIPPSALPKPAAAPAPPAIRTAPAPPLPPAARPTRTTTTPATSTVPERPEDVFSTPGNETPTKPSATEGEPSRSAEPPPSEVAPDLQIKR